MYTLTVNELDGLPIGSLAYDENGDYWEKERHHTHGSHWVCYVRTENIDLDPETTLTLLTTPQAS